MNLLNATAAIVFGLICCFATSQAKCDTVIETFPSASTYYSSSVSGTGYVAPLSGEMGTDGDYITQTFTGTGLASVTKVQLDYLVDNFVNLNQSVSWNIYLNGELLGTDTATSSCNCYAGAEIFSDDFPVNPPVQDAGTYTLKFEIANTMAPESGFVEFVAPGSASLIGISATPVPATLPLFAGGLVALGLFRWRNGQKAV